ncbi:hypothetical protein BaRGS_00039093 [Batillaria attramentaria]|uniref:Secreted protein n=1 Tax=Batillaria attramentaria TaxID=370345 RepID=A0ABD0J3X2_9CAEN
MWRRASVEHRLVAVWRPGLIIVAIPMVPRLAAIFCDTPTSRVYSIDTLTSPLPSACVGDKPTVHRYRAATEGTSIMRN